MEHYLDDSFGASSANEEAPRTATCYLIEGHDELFNTIEDAQDFRDFLCTVYGTQHGWSISTVVFDY